MPKEWFRGKRGGLFAFLAITTLVAGGLGWVTAAALRLEQEQIDARNQAEHFSNLRLALWRLDSLIAPALAKEDSRPYSHYNAIFAPPLALRPDGSACQPGSVLEISPLLTADLPEWMLLHFQVDCESGWRSPQVLSGSLTERLQKMNVLASLTNISPLRQRLLTELGGHVKADSLLALVQPGARAAALEELTLVPGDLSQTTGNSLTANSVPRQVVYGQQQRGQGGQGGQTVDSEYRTRVNRTEMDQQQSKSQNDPTSIVQENTTRNGEDWFLRTKKPRTSEQVMVALGPMIPLWLPSAERPERLVFARRVQIGKKEICQGIILDWPRLQQLLADEAKKEQLFPQARVEPVRLGDDDNKEDMLPHSERTMAVLPVQLDPGPVEGTAAVPGWTPLRFGLALAWTAALVGLSAVGLGGWSLIDLSQRRIRFVSAVTHELRTPLTTLRLYLDMLAGGMVTDPRQKEEYLQTLNTEADRLNRLVSNVLDFSRLENQRPRLAKSEVGVAEVLELVRSNWQTRCESSDKELVLENQVETPVTLFTDVQLVQQVLGNLIDNACKYSRGAPDRRVWLRARLEGLDRLIFEVEDQGPGVPVREQRSIFRPFRRGKDVDVTAGGVGLGLALGQRWAQVLGGKLAVHPGQKNTGACFRFELPVISR